MRRGRTHLPQGAETFPEGLGSLRNIAECEEEQSHFASARRAWWDLRLSVLQSSSSKYAGWDKDAEQAYAKLSPRVPRVKITVKGTDAPRLRVNGRPLDPRLVGTTLEQDVGTLEVVLDDGSASPPKRVVTLEEGKSYDIELQAVPHAKGPDVKGPGVKGAGGTAPTKPVETGISGMMIGGITAASVGGAALIGAGVALGVRQSALSEVEAGCADPDNYKLCDPSVQDAASRGQSASIAVDVLLAVGGVGVGVGVILIAVDATSGDDATPTAAAPKKAALKLEVVPRFGGGAFSLGGSF